VRQGGWGAWQSIRPIHPLAETTLGIVGFGRIGQTVADYLKQLVHKVIAYDPHVHTSPDPEVGLVDLPELLKRAGLVTIHAALSPSTHHLFDDAAFARMRPGAVLVNVSRGGIVDEQALARALRTRHLGGAGLDVLETEPAGTDHPLLAFENVIITNHIAWYSESSVIRQRTLMMERIRDYAAGRPVPSLVNPAVKAPSL
jgi:D-3-phosphoglycerate dehydrogenase